ncbi:phage tail tape measure protein [Tepidibacillus decaturensis]|uniref:Phage tail tape measure protein n=1 Tax=Tepidibacillus decaturensis TaxID=1413211 RepID=A0A135L1X4_9BACI|nr:hypothetical protein [Tepidibacillus decaturensis]KXG42879.1 hypothetical protein U473_01665 [Tepidibacillus decaturensis]
MAKRNSVEIVLAAQDQASKEIEKAIRKTTKEFGSLNKSLRNIGLEADEIDKINQKVKNANPKILENELANVRNQLKNLGLDATQIDKITTELKKAESVAEKAGKEIEKRLETLDNIGKKAMIAGAATTAGLTAVATEGFNVFEERFNAADNLVRQYGEQQAQLWQKWASNLEAKTAVSKDAFLQEAQAVYTLNKAYGLSIDQTQMLTQRSLDLAKAKGLDLSEANERVIAAIRGEAESAEYLGLTLNDTYMKNIALNGAYKDRWEKMTDLEKAQVRYQEFLKQSAYAEGIAEERANNNTAAMDRLQNSLKNASELYWKAVAPAVMTVTDKITSLTNWFNNLDEKTRNIITITSTFGSISLIAAGGIALTIVKVAQLVKLMKDYQIATKVAAASQTALNFVMNANPIGRIITVIGILVGALVTLYNTNDKVKIFMLNIWKDISSGVGTSIDWILAKIESLVSFIPGLSDKIEKFRQKTQQTFDDYEKKLTASIIKTQYVHSEMTKQISEEENFMIALKKRKAEESVASDNMVIASNANVVSSNAAVTQSYVEAKDAVEEYKAAQLSNIDFQRKEIDKAFEIRKAQLGEEANEQKKVTLELQHYQDEQKLVAQQLTILQEKYELSKHVKGENAEATRQLKLAIMDLQLEQINLTNSIEKSIQAMQQQKSIMVDDNDIIFKKNEDGAWVQIGKRGISKDVGTDAYRQANPDMPWWLGGGKKDEDIPGLAEGGSVTKSGLTWVGENGPELLNLPKGAEVRPLEKVPLLVGASAPIVLNFNFTGSNIFSDSKQQFKRFIQSEVAPIVSREIGKTVLKRKKI